MTHTDTPNDLEGIISEADVYEKYGHLFVDKELREARQRGLIAWLDMRKGVFYTREMLLDYLRSKVRTACPINQPLDHPEESSRLAESASKGASFRSATNGSPKKKGAALSIVAGMTPELAASAADLLEQRT